MIGSYRRLLAFALLGIISGAISATGVIPITPPDNFGLLLIFVLPGLAFGVIIGPALCCGGWLRPGRVPVWVVLATLGHFAAALCVTALTWRLQAAPTIAGATLGPLVLVQDAGPILGRLVFYVIWQAGYAAALALVLPPRWKQKSDAR